MAYDYEKVKQAYEGLNTQQKQQFADMMKGSGNYADFMSRYNAEKTPTATASTTTANSSTPAQTSTSTSRNIAKPEYQGTGSTGTKTSPYENQGEGNYYYSNQTNRYEKYPTATQTSTQTTKVETPAENDTVKQLRDAWNNKSYAEQQKLLNSNPKMQDTLTKYGITNKQPDSKGTVQSPYENQGPGNYYYDENTKRYEKIKEGGNQNNGEWDYQDNSPERMTEIIDNLDRISKSNPGLFSDYDTFYNAFIAGKGRSPEQEKVLNDYFNKMKQYNKYDNMSSDELGYLLAHGEPAEDYLAYLKYNDPQRYAEIQAVRKEEETKISNDSYLKTVAESEGFDMGDSNFWKWNQEEMGYRDANKDGLDDRLYHEPTEEEKKLWEEDASYEAERLRIQNAYKDLQSDLTEQYPDADLSTIMVLTSDRGNKMLKALDTLSVSQTKVQGMIKYMQNERTTQNQAGQQTIAEIQKNLGMYYDYTPEGMAERAQAQYAATNVTLDQADNGTDTQKQMALDRVLSDYYDKYGSIIQRSKSQVINDVMAYAKKNGVSLSQALEENFLKFLRQKPEYATLSSGGSLTADKWAKLNDNTLYNVTTGEIMSATGSNLGSSWASTPGEVAGSERSGGNQIKLGEQATDTGIKNVYGTNVKLAPTVGNMLQEAVDNLKSQGIDLQIGDSYRSYETQKRAYEEDQAKPANQRKGVAAPGKSFHEIGQAIDIAQNQMNDPAVIQALLDAGFTRPVKSEPRHWSYGEGKDAFGGTKSNSTTTYNNILNNKFGNNPDWNRNGYFNSLGKDLEGYIEDGKLKIPNEQYKSLKESYGINDQEFRIMAQNYADNELKSTGGSQASRALEMAIKTYEYLYGPNNGGAEIDFDGDTWLGRQIGGRAPFSNVGMAKTEFESMLNRLTLKELFDAKALGATFGAMSKDEWDVLANAATDVKWGAGNFKENMEDLIESLYTATIDGNSQLPKNWDGSKAQDMVNTRITNGTALGNYGNATTIKSSTSKNNGINNPYGNSQDKYDDEWNS